MNYQSHVTCKYRLAFLWIKIWSDDEVLPIFTKMDERIDGIKLRFMGNTPWIGPFCYFFLRKVRNTFTPELEKCDHNGTRAKRQTPAASFLRSFRVAFSRKFWGAPHMWVKKKSFHSYLLRSESDCFHAEVKARRRARRRNGWRGIELFHIRPHKELDYA